MKKLISITLILIGLNINAQEIMTDWNELDGQTTLKEYIENQAYDHLNFTPTEKDSLKNNGLGISHRSSDTKIVVRYHTPIADKPLVIINQYPTDKLEIWTSIKLIDLKNISFIKSTDKASALYGTRGQKGVIIVEMNKRRWRKLRRKYGR